MGSVQMGAPFVIPMVSVPGSNRIFLRELGAAGMGMALPAAERVSRRPVAFHLRAVVVTENRNPGPDITDEDLVGRMAAGDTEAFGVFYDRHVGMLLALALRMLQSEADAADVVQDVLVMFWERAAIFDASKGRPVSWVIAAVRNRAIDIIRTKQRRDRLLTEAAEDVPATGAAVLDPPQRLAQLEVAGQVNAALRSLPPAQQQAIELAFFGGMSQSEIAEALGEPLGTIKARLRRGMIQLRDSLRQNL